MLNKREKKELSSSKGGKKLSACRGERSAVGAPLGLCSPSAGCGELGCGVYLFHRWVLSFGGTSRADSRGSGAGLVPGPQALPSSDSILYFPNTQKHICSPSARAEADSDPKCRAFKCWRAAVAVSQCQIIDFE
jgi:hypothetical protein